jgi:tRNA(His) 5'-end guanylyltransferase
LNAHCFWKLRSEGQTANQATNALARLSIAEKNELLFARCINFNDLPSWQKRGIGIVWAEHEKPAINEKTGEPVTAIRRRLSRIYDLPMRDEYSQFIAGLIR